MLPLAAAHETGHYTVAMPQQSSPESTLSTGESADIRHALDYPYARPTDSYVYINGEVVPLVQFHRHRPGDSLIRGTSGDVSLARHLRAAGIDQAVLDPPRRAVIASGSNAAPAQLARKFAGFRQDVVIPVLRSRLADFASVYAAHITRYGAVPATLQYLPGAAAELFVTWLTAPQLARMHETEALGRNYGFARLGNLRLALDDGPAGGVFAYLGLRGNLHVDGEHVALDGGTAPALRGLRVASQRQVQEQVRDLLAPALPLHDFIAENIRDTALRNRRIRLLRAFSFPFAGPDHRLEHGPPTGVDAEFFD